ncbi:MAG: carboxypeptidase regulatory-like domain-containing protein [Parafilimonas sp.]
MITQEQSREFTRCTKLQQFLDANQTVFESFEPFADEYTQFSANMVTFEGLIPDKNVNTKGITTDKSTLKQSVADALGAICRKTYSYALKQDDGELAAQVNTRADLIIRIKDSALLGYVITMGETITPLLTNTDYMKYGVTAAQLLAIKTDAIKFNNMIGKADVTGSTGTVANAAIDAIIDALRLNIKHFDLLIEEFETSNPGFVLGYHINSEVDNNGIRHNGIEGHVHSKTGDAISGATIALQGTTKSTVTDLMGYYHLDRVRPDDYMVTCNANGFTVQSKVHHISRGRTDEIDWEL